MTRTSRGTATLGNLLIGNLVGTSADGSRAVANGQDGITIGSSSDNTVGGVNGLNADGSIASMSGNLISGNTSAGLTITGFPPRPATWSWATRSAWTWKASAVPNGLEGILVNSGASNNTIGAANLDGRPPTSSRATP